MLLMQAFRSLPSVREMTAVDPLAALRRGREQ
jgi:hypothetical protein